MRLGGLALRLILLGPLWPCSAATAQETMEWQFYPPSGPGTQASLVYGVPETDNVQAMGLCDAASATGAKSATLTFAADIGDIETGEDVTLRFSGGGFDHALPGLTYRPQSEEGIVGVQLSIAHDDPLWTAMAEKASLDYLVQGYKAATIDFERGRDNIQAFLQACRSSAAAPPIEGNNAEKEAFDSAKELGTAEAYEAFLSSYSTGFYADLARAYVKQLKEKPAAPTAAPKSPKPEAKTDPKPKKKKYEPATSCRELGMDYRGGKCVAKAKKDVERYKKKKNVACPPGMYRNQLGQCQPNETGG